MATTKKAPATKSTSKEPAKAASAVSIKALRPYNSIVLERLVEKGEVVENVSEERAAVLVDKGLVEII